MSVEAGLVRDQQNGNFTFFHLNELEETGLRLTNVFMSRPPDNKLEYWCGKKMDMPAGYPSLPSIETGKYLRPEFFPHLLRTHHELLAAKPNLIVALGNTAVWFLIGQTGITSMRGYLHETPYGKVLPTYHPAAVLRNWHLRTIVKADLMKAVGEMERPEIIRPRREIWIEPSIDDIRDFYEEHLCQAETISVDIETIPSRRLIKCISFGKDTTHAIVIPLIDTRKPDWLYWGTADLQVRALIWIRLILSLPQPKCTQNGMYDFQWIWKYFGMTPRNWCKDSMLIHWSKYPESPKDLGFLGSIYTNEAPWKFWHRHEQGKKDE